MSEFYTSGGLNDSTGREPFEDGTPLVRQGGDYDSSSSSGAPGAGNGLGDGNLVATTGDNQGGRTGFAGQTAGTRGDGNDTGISSDRADHYDNSAKDRVRDQFDSNDNNRTGTGISSDRSDHYDNSARDRVADQYQSSGNNDSGKINTGGLTGGFGNTEGSRTRVADQNDHTGRGITAGRDNSNSGTGGLRQTGDSYEGGQDSSSGLGGAGIRQTGDSYEGGQDRSAGYGRDGGVGNQGVAGGSNFGSDNLSSGAAGTDRFDSNQSSSGATHGQAIGDKRVDNDNIGRHGDDFTGGFAATGGAYTNPNTKTGLTGRETTTSGVQDKDANPTQSSGGLVSKIKNAVGLSHDNSAQANASTDRDNI